MNIGIIGYGGVGKTLLKLLVDKKRYLETQALFPKILFILKSNGGIYDPSGIDCEDLINFTQTESDITLYPKGGSNSINFKEVLEKTDIDVLIELTPTNIETGEPALTHIKEALTKGINVVTGNKGPILLAYHQLKELAVKKNVQLCIGCTTGGALPTINAGLIDLAGANIISIEGILNGTTNFILQEMEEKHISYKEALKTAQKLGIAERNPYLDVEGWDTATKLLILTNTLMKTKKKLSDVQVEGITHITLDDIKSARKEGKKYKLIGKAQMLEGQVDLKVKLEKLKQNHPLYNIDGKNKGVKYTSDTLGDLTIIGGGSGLVPAAASILRDIINLHRGYKFII